jgi:hypothetical protein
MSYARFGRNSDVYVLNDYECMGCKLDKTHDIGRFRCNTAEEMINHLKEHKRAGYDVPVSTFTRLYAETNTLKGVFFWGYYYGKGRIWTFMRRVISAVYPYQLEDYLNNRYLKKFCKEREKEYPELAELIRKVVR